MSSEPRWRRRPVAAATVRALIAAVPVLAAVAAGLAVARVVPRPAAGLQVVLWWGMLLAVTTVVLLAAERIARRFLPLATLLRLSLLFPDRVPSRFAVALRASSTRRLAERLSELADDTEPAEAAKSILSLIGALTLHDRPSRGHSERVRAFTDLIAAEMDLTAADRERLRWAALLHDIGKMTVPATMLNKPSTLDDHEWTVMRRHPEEGARMVQPLAGFLGEWAQTVGQHHERWDGSGYPAGLAGEQIARGARIVAVADAFEVMTGVRTYRRPLDAEGARTELVANNASQFDPAVVRAFLNVSLDDLQRVLVPLAWLVQIPVVGGLGGAEQPAAAPDASPHATHPLAALHPDASPHPALGSHPAWGDGDGGDDGDSAADALVALQDQDR